MDRERVRASPRLGSVRGAVKPTPPERGSGCPSASAITKDACLGLPPSLPAQTVIFLFSLLHMFPRARIGMSALPSDDKKAYEAALDLLGLRDRYRDPLPAEVSEVSVVLSALEGAHASPRSGPYVDGCLVSD